MATANEKEQIVLTNQQAAQQNASTQPVSGVQPQQQTAQGNTQQQTQTPYKSLYGVSDNTNSNLQRLSQGYRQSDAVNRAQAYLDSITGNKPAEYTDKYSDQLASTYDAIVNRKPFQYSINGDAMYQQYKDQYQRMGQRAMQDTMGQASAMTGGYGSSYTTTAGNQAYQNYLAQLNQIVPQLQANARSAYDAEGANLNNLLSTTQSLSNQDYGRYQDELNNWYTQQQMAQAAYDAERSFDYGNYTNDLNYWTQQAQLENADAYNQRQYAMSLVSQILAMGNLPSKELQAMAGLSNEDLKALRTKNVVYVNGGGGGASGGSGSYTANEKTNSLKGLADIYNTYVNTGVSPESAEALRTAGTSLKQNALDKNKYPVYTVK